MRNARHGIIYIFISAMLGAFALMLPLFIQTEPVFADPNPPTVIMIENKSIDPGEVVTLGVYANNVTRLVGYHISITYEQEVINVISSSPENTTNYSDPGHVYATGLRDVQDGVTGNIKLFELTIEAKGSSGSTSPLTIEVIELDGLLNYPDIESVSIPHTIQNGSITINSTAASIAAGISTISAPAKDATQLTLPSVPDGYTIGIHTTDNQSVITTSGKITPPSADTIVNITFVVTRSSDNSFAETAKISVVVPAKTSVGSSISGRINLPTGSNHSGITVSIVGETITTTTMTDGSFTLTEIPSGIYSIRIQMLKHLDKMLTGINIGTGENKQISGVTTLYAGDANNDNKVNLQDLILLSNSYGKTQGDIGYNENSEFNNDNKVNLQDLILLSNAYGKSGD